MSRMTAKKVKGKRRKKLFMGMMVIFFSLIIGLLVVDGAHREMMASYGEKPVLGYIREGQVHTFLFVGNELAISRQQIVEEVRLLVELGKEKVGWLKAQIQSRF